MPDYRCKACGAEFESQEKLESHNRAQHAPGPSGGTPDSSKR